MKHAEPDIRQWICGQIGAREHYAVPRAFRASGRLDWLYTDFWATACTRWAARATGARVLRSLSSRWRPELVEAKVAAWNARSFVWEAELRRAARKGGVAGRYLGYAEVGRQFAQRVRGELLRRGVLDERSAFFAYDTGALEVFEALKERGVPCVLNQMDPSRVEVAMVREEEGRWPGWQVGSLDVPEAYFVRREREWALADRVVVNSAFCRRALVQQGVPDEKIVEIPLSFEAPWGAGAEAALAAVKRQGERGKVRVLWLGQVILRKGIQYLIEAARQLPADRFQIDVVGPVAISPEAVASAPAHVRFHGRATRDQAPGWYRGADIFVLPTISDGFALTQLEAMAHGLPVIATPNCGNVVRHGVDGLIVPIRDSAALARAIIRFADEPAWAAECSRQALVRVRDFSLDVLAANLLKLERT